MSTMVVMPASIVFAKPGTLTRTLHDFVPVENLAESLRVAFDAGAKRFLFPMASVRDIPSVPGELFAKFQTSFYADQVDAVFKAMGVQ
jgi:ATP-dependent Lon protease